VIFIGIEESTYDRNPQDYEQRLTIQSQLNPYTDLRELCDTLERHPSLYNPQKHPPQPQPTWSPLCSVMLGISGSPINQIGDESAILDYQRRQLGRTDGDSLLAELFPMPKSGGNSFNEIHRSLLGVPRVDGADLLDAYHELVLAERQERLAKMLAERFANFPPHLVIAYGRPWP
jgi:hypothetical protein